MSRTGQRAGSKDTSVAAVTLFEADVREKAYLMFRLTPATEALTALSVEVKVHPDDTTWITLASAAGDFTGPRGPIFGASGDLTTLAAAATGWAIIQIAGFAKLRVQATAAGDGTCAYSFYAHGGS